MTWLATLDSSRNLRFEYVEECRPSILAVVNGSIFWKTAAWSSSKNSLWNHRRIGDAGWLWEKSSASMHTTTRSKIQSTDLKMNSQIEACVWKWKDFEKCLGCKWFVFALRISLHCINLFIYVLPYQPAVWFLALFLISRFGGTVVRTVAWVARVGIGGIVSFGIISLQPYPDNGGCGLGLIRVN